MLMQKDDSNVLHPVAFFSKTMNQAQRNYDVYNRELLAFVETCRHWRHYLHQPAHTVKVHTDHANLLYWKNPGEHNRRVARWHVELMEYDFTLVHLPGKKNGRTDALSRCYVRTSFYHADTSDCIISYLSPPYTEALVRYDLVTLTCTIQSCQLSVVRYQSRSHAYYDT